MSFKTNMKLYSEFNLRCSLKCDGRVQKYLQNLLLGGNVRERKRKQKKEKNTSSAISAFKKAQSSRARSLKPQCSKELKFMEPDQNHLDHKKNIAGYLFSLCHKRSYILLVTAYSFYFCRFQNLTFPPKGQLISKCAFGVIVWTKIPTKKFLPQNLKSGEINSYFFNFQPNRLENFSL